MNKKNCDIIYWLLKEIHKGVILIFIFNLKIFKNTLSKYAIVSNAYNTVLLHDRTLFNRKYTTSRPVCNSVSGFAYKGPHTLCQTDQPRPCSVDLAVNIKLHVIVPHPYPYPGHAEQGHDEVGNFVVVIVVHLLSVDPFYLETFPHWFQIIWIWIAQADTKGERMLLNHI